MVLYGEQSTGTAQAQHRHSTAEDMLCTIHQSYAVKWTLNTKMITNSNIKFCFSGFDSKQIHYPCIRWLMSVCFNCKIRSKFAFHVNTRKIFTESFAQTNDPLEAEHRTALSTGKRFWIFTFFQNILEYNIICSEF